MVNFNGNYYKEELIEQIEIFDSGDANFPFGLQIVLSGGRSVGVRYANEARRDQDKNRLINDIGRHQQRITEQNEVIICRLRGVGNAIERIEKRQMRIQKVLKNIFKCQSLEE